MTTDWELSVKRCGLGLAVQEEQSMADVVTEQKRDPSSFAQQIEMKSSVIGRPDVLLMIGQDGAKRFHHCLNFGLRRALHGYSSLNS